MPQAIFQANIFQNNIFQVGASIDLGAPIRIFGFMQAPSVIGCTQYLAIDGVTQLPEVVGATQQIKIDGIVPDLTIAGERQ